MRRDGLRRDAGATAGAASDERSPFRSTELLDASNRHRIVIVGGGAGGLELAARLGESLGAAGDADVVLVDGQLTHFWKPLLHEVAAGTLPPHANHGDYLQQARRH